MKKSFVAFSLFLFTFASVFANKETTSNYGYYYGKGESFNFMEENVHFMVYQNGEFDFFIEQPGVTVGVNLGNVNITFNSGFNYDPFVLYDDFGAIIQIEDIPIYYDYYGRISRIGNTYIRYRNRRLIQFGGLYVHYNYYGNYDYCSGYINVYNRHYNYRPYVSYFARPLYNHCIVSYEPYRRAYRPVRYRYNSTEFRRRARNNSYYRSSSKVATRRRSIPRRVAPRTRTSVRRNHSVATNTEIRNRSVRRSSNTRRIESNRVTTRPNRSMENHRNSNGTTIRRREVTRNTSVRNHGERSLSERRKTPSKRTNRTIKSDVSRSRKTNRSPNISKKRNVSVKRNTAQRHTNRNTTSKNIRRRR